MCLFSQIKKNPRRIPKNRPKKGGKIVFNRIKIESRNQYFRS